MNIPTSLSVDRNLDPELFNLFGSIPTRCYSLLRVADIALAYTVVHRQYHNRKVDGKTFEPLFFYCFFGILTEARLGHCLFYQPNYYLDHFWGMILPTKFLPDGGWKWMGYEGLASHGGTLGLITSLWMYCHRTKIHYTDVLDMIAAATPITACYTHLANPMNSEIIGMPTSVPWAFVFERVDMLPRHPAQFYETIAYFILFLGMICLCKHGQKKQESRLKADFSTTKAKSAAVQAVASLPYRRGFFFGLCLTKIFVFRFFIKFLREDQVNFEKTIALNMGQWLSVPFILIRIYFMCFYGKKTAGKQYLPAIEEL